MSDYTIEQNNSQAPMRSQDTSRLEYAQTPTNIQGSPDYRPIVPHDTTKFNESQQAEVLRVNHKEASKPKQLIFEWFTFAVLIATILILLVVFWGSYKAKDPKDGRTMCNRVYLVVTATLLTAAIVAAVMLGLRNFGK